MLLFSTRSTRHLATMITAHHGACTIKQFSDGELFVRIDEDIAAKHVWVLTATNAPAENILELLFLLNALERAGAASISLLFTYFGYARHKASYGEAQSTHVIIAALQAVKLKKIYIIHAHTSELLRNLLPFTDLYDVSFFCEHAHNYDVIAAPDKGALPFAQHIAQACSKELIVITKERPEPEHVTITSIEGSVRGKRILLVDDIIATGRTIIEAANALQELGAYSVSAAATHGIFSSGAHERIAESILETVYVTNTLPQQSHNKIIVTDIGPFIANILYKNS